MIGEGVKSSSVLVVKTHILGVSILYHYGININHPLYRVVVMLLLL